MLDRKRTALPHRTYDAIRDTIGAHLSTERRVFILKRFVACPFLIGSMLLDCLAVAQAQDLELAPANAAMFRAGHTQQTPTKFVVRQRFPNVFDHAA
ncbi:hypothetical protein [Nocardia acidivorans]|uniref:hypothetical protein n=1 Tax=Nocardia acidivorans TaxID=404580 RepID=UPI00083573F4|nr:hypothetical protein [Nocardia acidivorans]